VKPIPAAIQLTKFWRTICPPDEVYPVDSRKLAEALGIKVHGAAIDDDFEAQLRISGDFRAIIYNENIREEGRKNFSIAHELGHHSCHGLESSCSSNNLNDMDSQPNNIEQEANLFAATLLMPIDDFRVQVQGRDPTLTFIRTLADERYKTTLTATCRRLIDLSPTRYYGMVFVRGNRIHRWARTENMRYTGFGFPKGHEIPIVVNHNPDGEEVESSVWLNEKNAPKWILTQSSIHMPNYGETLVLIKAERSEEFDELEEPDPTPPSIPSFR
jgi:Zn-dependent peptidase ImmA (M78 family)